MVVWPNPFSHTISPSMEVHACNCIGPQNGDPVCPCQMRGYMERKTADHALEMMQRVIALDLRYGKRRVRVKAGSRQI